MNEETFPSGGGGEGAVAPEIKYPEICNVSEKLKVRPSGKFLYCA